MNEGVGKKPPIDFAEGYANVGDVAKSGEVSRLIVRFHKSYSSAQFKKCKVCRTETQMRLTYTMGIKHARRLVQTWAICSPCRSTIELKLRILQHQHPEYNGHVED